MKDYQLPAKGLSQWQPNPYRREIPPTVGSPLGELMALRNVYVDVITSPEMHNRGVLTFNYAGTASTLAYADKPELARLKALARRCYDPTNILYIESTRPPRPKNEILIDQRISLLVDNWTESDGVFTAEYVLKETRCVVTNTSN